MTSKFDQELIDSAAHLVDTCGESVTYYPKAGGSRAITAIVNRGQPGGLDGPPHGAAPRLIICVENDSTSGISSDEIDTGGDEVKVAVRIGETAQKRRITKIVTMDAGMMELELR